MGHASIAVVEDDFFAQRDHIRESLAKGEVLDFNSLSPTAKQAALSLTEERAARLVERNGRLVIEGRKSNPFVKVLTAGLMS